MKVLITNNIILADLRSGARINEVNIVLNSMLNWYWSYRNKNKDTYFDIDDYRVSVKRLNKDSKIENGVKLSSSNID